MIIISTILSFSKEYQLEVINGYGSGKFNEGDTVYVYCKELLNNETLNTWISDKPDLKFLSDNRELWTKFTMPSSNVKITAVLNNLLPDDFLKYESIKGLINYKNVYYSLDPNNKGIVFLFHGGGGSAKNLIGNENYDKYYIAKCLVANDFGIVITESEETTIHEDTDNSGLFTWQALPYDKQTNPDYANFVFIMDYLSQKGIVNKNAPWFSFGMSNGGGFSGHFSYVFNCNAAAIYAASSQKQLVEKTKVPYFYLLMPNDEALREGGNKDAERNHEILKSRGVPTELYYAELMPLYPEYFLRSEGIVTNESKLIFEELKINNVLNSKNILIKPLSEIQEELIKNPKKWPVINSLSKSEKGQISSLLNIAYGGHELNSNYVARTKEFFERFLLTNSVLSEGNNLEELIISPNPASDYIEIYLDKVILSEAKNPVKIYNTFGECVIDLTPTPLQKGEGLRINISHLPVGIYFLKFGNYLKKFIVVR
jgi:hypothetical protein